jgi:hypothetical protein
MCKALEVSPSGYYAWKTRPLSKRALSDRYLVNQVQQVHIASRQNYGVIKTWKALRENGICCGKHRVARLRRITALKASAASASRLQHGQRIPNGLRRTAKPLF